MSRQLAGSPIVNEALEPARWLQEAAGMPRISFCHEIRRHLLPGGLISSETSSPRLGPCDRIEKRQKTMAVDCEGCNRGMKQKEQTLKEVEFCEAAASSTAAPSQEWSQLTPNNKRSRMATMRPAWLACTGYGALHSSPSLLVSKDP